MPQVPEEYEETPCLDLVAGSPSTLHTPHSQRARPPPLAGQARISQPRSSFPERPSTRALLRREDTRTASQTAGALATPVIYFISA